MYFPYLPYKKAFVCHYTDFQQCNVKPNRQLFHFAQKLLEIISDTIEICAIPMHGFLNVTFHDLKLLKACIFPCKPWIEGWSACPYRHNMQWKVCNLILKFPWKSNEVSNYTKINKNVELHCEIHNMANLITYCVYY